LQHWHSCHFVCECSKIARKKHILSRNYILLEVRIADFMIQKKDVVAVRSNQTIREAGKLICDKGIGSVVVISDTEVPVGTITRTELVQGYITDVPVGNTMVHIMRTQLVWIEDTKQKDQLAELMMHTKEHHVLVKNVRGEFVGLVASLDVVRETALDAKAFSFNRQKVPK
jgi:predicted transcriptional regulator